MTECIEIKNHKKEISIFLDQFGQITGFVLGLIIASFFVDRLLIYYGMIIVIPIIIILLKSKFNKTVLSVNINSATKIFEFEVARIGRPNRLFKIPFNKIQVIHRYKWLLYFYQEVIEIKQDKNLKIGYTLVSKENKKFNDQFLTNIRILIKSKNLNENQLKDRHIKSTRPNN